MFKFHSCPPTPYDNEDTMDYIRIDDDRLTYRQYERLMTIMDHLAKPRPDLEWGGMRRESKNLTKPQWQTRLSRELYITYRDLHPNDEISRDQVNDFFDDDYVYKLTSFRLRLKKWLYKRVKCCFSSNPTKKEGDDGL